MKNFHFELKLLFVWLVRHSQNKRSLAMSNLRLQYRTRLSAVVTAITTRRITPEILPVSSLRKSLKINNTLFEHDI